MDTNYEIEKQLRIWIQEARLALERELPSAWRVMEFEGFDQPKGPEWGNFVITGRVDRKDGTTRFVERMRGYGATPEEAARECLRLVQHAIAALS